MINIYDGELLDYMPGTFNKDPKVASISFAIKRAWDVVHRMSLKTRILYAVDEMTDDVLDLLAAELGCAYYDSDFPIDTKRKVIKEAMNSEIKGGTVQSMENILTAIYGDAEEVEWYDYGGEPGHFRMKIKAINSIDMSRISEVLAKIKRTSAHLDKIYADVEAAEEKVIVANIPQVYQDVRLSEQQSIRLEEAVQEAFVSHVTVQTEVTMMRFDLDKTDLLIDGNGGVVLDENYLIINVPTYTDIDIYEPDDGDDDDGGWN